VIRATIRRVWVRLWHLDGDMAAQRQAAEEQRLHLETKLEATRRDTIPRVRRQTDAFAAEVERALRSLR